MSAIKKFLLLYCLIYSATAHASEIMPSAEMSDAAKNAASFKSRPISPDLQKRLGQIQKTIESPEWQENRDKYRRQLNTAFNLPQLEQGSEKAPETKDRLVLFVSASMPPQALRRYAKDLDKVGGVMVMRGAIGGLKKLQPTMEFIASFLRLDPTCNTASCQMRSTPVLIDPILFRKNDIKAVPALTYQRDMHLSSYCEGIESTKPAQHIIYGAASLKAMLVELNQLGGNKALLEIADRL